MQWFRFYHEVLHDSKVQTLPPELFRSWINILCIASESEDRGTLPSLRQVAFLLRVKEPKAKEILDELDRAGLLDHDPESGSLAPHNWVARQPEGDNSSDRVRRYRDRIKSAGETVTGYTKYRDEVFARDGHACVYCLKTKRLVLDHLIPVARGGLGQPDNLVTACKACNAGKAGRLVEEVGYIFKNANASALYVTAKSRFGVRDACGESPLPVTVTGNRDTVTETPRVRADSDSDSDSDSEQNPPTPGGVVVVACEDSLSLEARQAIEDIRVRHGTPAAELARREASIIDRQLGGRWDLFGEAMDAASRRRPKLEDRNVLSWCLARATANLGKPPGGARANGQGPPSPADEKRRKQDAAFEAAVASIDEDI